MNKEGVYRVIESAIKQYYRETGVIVTNINIDVLETGLYEDKPDIVLKIGTEEYQGNYR